MIYYIDPHNGNNAFDGTSPEKARQDYHDIAVKPGDSVLFRRGSVIRGTLDRAQGEDGAPVTYGAWGEGKAPVFCGSVDVSLPEYWHELRPNVWKLTKELPSEACNFIYDGGRTGATLRWDEYDLSKQGDWYDSTAGDHESRTLADEKKVLLYSEGNPGRVYSHIECAVWGKRCMSQNVPNTVCEDLCFYGSGVHALSGGCRNMTVRRCSFIFIGGAVWNRQLRIRFGNAIEFWEYGENILIEDCYFNNIYDSCITEQGSDNCQPAKNLVMRNNLFINYGMGAYEGRDRMLVDSVFENNLCIYAGGGFSAFGDTVPRNSEIYPQPMGHHLFMWRIPKASQGGCFIVAGNHFYDATGAAVYSIISREAEEQMRLEDNKYYTSSKSLFTHVGGKDYADFDGYMSDFGEIGAVYISSPDIASEAEKWFEKSGCTRQGEALFTDKLPPRKYFIGSTDEDALSYSIGEDMCFRIQLVEDGKKIGCPVLSYIRRGDDGIFEEGFADGSSGELVYHTSIERAGYVHLTVTAFDENEAPLKGYEIFEGGACAGFDDIRVGVSEPVDFDKFWNDTIKNELDTVSPVVLEKKEFSSGDPGDVVYDIKVACAGKYPVSGYLRLPRDAREGELPIIVRYIGYSVDTAPIPPKKRAIQFSINPHGINNGESSKYYDNLEKNELSAFGFRNEENASPETVYFKYMVLRAIQALRFCKTIPIWDKKNITLVGGSMGAMQAVSAAAHDDGVTRLEIEIPWLCDLRGIEKGRLEGWRPENSRGMDYYDTVYQAARVKCETFITAGLGDYICPPSGVTALYHALGGKKHLTMQQNRTHPYIAPEFEVYER